MAEWKKLADDWNKLSDSEKEALFQQTTLEAVTLDDFQKIKDAGVKKFRIASRSLEGIGHSYDMDTLPDYSSENSKVVKPAKFICGSKLKTIHSFSANTNIKASDGSQAGIDVCVIKTDDDKAYDMNDAWTYDFKREEWVQGGRWMPVENLERVREIDWRKLFPMKKHLGFAFRFRIEKPEDVCELMSFTVNADVQEGWSKVLPGATTFTYSYPTDDTLEIKFFASGDYKVNYDSGYHRKED